MANAAGTGKLQIRFLSCLGALSPGPGSLPRLRDSFFWGEAAARLLRELESGGTRKQEPAALHKWQGQGWLSELLDVM